MRHNNNSRRSRGRNNNRRPNSGGNSKTQTFDSNGPDVRIRGNAFQLTEKYMTLARDASSAGDTILAESYYQHAEHYQRMINEFSSASDRTNETGDTPKVEEPKAKVEEPKEKIEEPKSDATADKKPEPM